MTACTAGTDCVTEFTTFFGTGLSGMFITFKNTAVDNAGTISASTELEMDFDIRLYTCNTCTTKSGDLFANANTEAYYMLMFVNPYETATAPNEPLTDVKNSAALIKLDVTNTANEIAVVNDGSQGPESAECTADDLSTISGSWTTDCTLNSGDGGTNEITSVTTNSCAEKWSIEGGFTQCVRISGAVKRPFQT